MAKDASRTHKAVDMEVAMRAVIIIPARYASQRLPGKVLLRQTGKYLVQHVYEQASRARRAQEVIVATDDSRVVAAVKSFGGRVALTRRDHSTGTDRVAEVASQLDCDIVINVQGDEPLLEPHGLDVLVELLERDSQAPMATLAVPIHSLEQWLEPHCVKVVCDTRGRALYFSRSPIPYVRDGLPDFSRKPPQFFQHLGVYAYRRPFLLQLASWPPHPLEQLEKLEQLRVLASGHPICVGVVNHLAIGVDTYADYEKFVSVYRHQLAA
jgi:3-deoxy-manno-octulosonate cytidylyltransferase (CMP-KDO synthetase)